ncbi:PaaI family thioesterase [soil metagenome]
MQTLGAEILRLAHGECRIACTVSPGFGQQHGFVHAAVLVALADTAGGYAAFTMTGNDEDVLTSELKLNCLGPAKSTRLIGTRKVIRAGKRLVVCEIRTLANAGRADVCCVVGLQTLVRIRSRAVP